MNKEVKQVSYMDWKPAISAEDVYKSTVGFQYLHADTKGNVFWIENRPNEGGRSVLVWRNSSGLITDLTPSPYSVRTRVFEYGSTPYTTHEGWVYFANFKDQRLYKQHLEDPKKVIPVTPESLASGGLGKYAEMSVSPDGKWMVFAYEVEPKSGGHPNNYIAVIDLQSEGLKEPRIITSGADFYTKPRFSNDGSKLAWLEWNHPYMRWDSTRLFLADFKNGEVVENKKTRVAGSDDSSITDFNFDSSGTLFFSADFASRKENSFENYYNIYAFKEGKVVPSQSWWKFKGVIS